MELIYVFLRRRGFAPGEIGECTYPQYLLERLADLPPQEVDYSIDETGESLKHIFG